MTMMTRGRMMTTRHIYLITDGSFIPVFWRLFIRWTFGLLSLRVSLFPLFLFLLPLSFFLCLNVKPSEGWYSDLCLAISSPSIFPHPPCLPYSFPFPSSMPRISFLLKGHGIAHKLKWGFKRDHCHFLPRRDVVDFSSSLLMFISICCFAGTRDSGQWQIEVVYSLSLSTLLRVTWTCQLWLNPDTLDTHKKRKSFPQLSFKTLTDTVPCVLIWTHQHFN